MRMVRPCLVSTKLDGHRYAVVYDRECPQAALVAIGRWTVNRELNLTWFAAAFMAADVRRRARKDRIKV